MNILFFKKINNLTHSTTLTTILFILVVCGFVFGQKTDTKEECPDDKKKEKISTKNPTLVAPKVVTTSTNFNFRIGNFSRIEYVDEKFIAVHPKVYVSLCMLQGSVKVNGWSRNEARIFVRNDKKNQIGFKVREFDRRDKKPVWIQVLGYNPKEVLAETTENTCLSGEIELDVPENASVTIENSKGESETTIDSVRVAKVEVLGGDIYLNNIADRIDAHTYKGGVTVRNSSGKMDLTTTNGNIVASNTFSSETGDFFKAKTNSGAITLQSVEQKEVSTSSTVGAINFIGEIKPFGKYDFYTTNGSINLAIPADTSCHLVAAYGGSFLSELPLKDITKERTESLVYLKAKMGKGEANLNLKSFNGTISIREKKESVLAKF